MKSVIQNGTAENNILPENEKSMCCIIKYFKKYVNY